MLWPIQYLSRALASIPLNTRGKKTQCEDAELLCVSAACYYDDDDDGDYICGFFLFMLVHSKSGSRTSARKCFSRIVGKKSEANVALLCITYLNDDGARETCSCARARSNVIQN